ncbi:MAG: metallophosphoesterase [Candidatus Bipolaricaulia bacterium]
MTKKLTLYAFLLLFLVGLCLPTFAVRAESSKSFSVVVLPDTQGYSEGNPEIFLSQTHWIVENRKRLDIKLVIHLGDLVEHPESQKEWRRAEKAMDVLDRNEVPTLVTFGNHDYTSLGDDRTSNPFNEYFPLSRYEGSSHFGGSFSEDSAGNVYMTLVVGGQKYLFLTVEYKPRDEVLAWASGVLENHLKFRAILVTHSYMWPNGFLTSSGDRIWDELANKHSNVWMVLCGHVPGAGVEVDYGEPGNKVIQILSDYQYYSNGGNGYLRIMRFHPKEGEVQVRTYSPYLDSYKSEKWEEFEVSLE